ncbi:MAG: hypothetical protein AB1346_04450 [Thermodesulfobacteriota bacterium]
MKKFMAVIAAMALAAAAVPAFAGGGPGYSGDAVPFGVEKSITAKGWPASEPVETGSVQAKSLADRLSPTDTHYNPFYPETRVIDLGGGGN